MENKHIAVSGRKRLYILAALALVASALIIFILINSSANTVFVDISDFGVLIDPGHGGDDVGAIAPASGAHEAPLNLAVANALAEQLRQRGVYAELTRKDDNALGSTKDADMQARGATIASTDCGVMISIHMNSFPDDTSVCGPQVFYQQGDRESERLANIIQDKLNSFSGGSRRPLEYDLFVLRSAKVPAVLIECGFLTNADEDAKLQTAEYQQGLAKAVADAIVQ